VTVGGTTVAVAVAEGVAAGGTVAVATGADVAVAIAVVLVAVGTGVGPESELSSPDSPHPTSSGKVQMMETAQKRTTGRIRIIETPLVSTDDSSHG
jgi:hypothetical protein